MPQLKTQKILQYPDLMMGQNQPWGKGMGINPGRVVWVWSPEATNENCSNKFDSPDWFFKPENTNRAVVSKMVSDAVKKLTGNASLSESWDALFHYHNNLRKKKNTGYTAGEKIFIKINQETANRVLNPEDIKTGYFYPKNLSTGGDESNILGAAETGPFVVLEILRQLVYEMGINQSDIAVGDPMNHIYGQNYTAWVNEYPKVHYVDKSSASNGRTIISSTPEDLIYYSDKTMNDKLYDIIQKADYLINIATLKPHAAAGISLTAMNYSGSVGRDEALHLDYSLPAPSAPGHPSGKPSNAGYRKYRVLVDLMGSKYLGQNTVLFLVEGLFGGGTAPGGRPVKYIMPPFNNDWCNSIYVSQDQVALESVCFDFLRTEWNRNNKHNASNNDDEYFPNINGVDDYLHQAADSGNWPKALIYDPDRTGKPIASLGTHEHWNNAEKMQYSGNMGHHAGIELISIPDTLIKFVKVQESAGNVIPVNNSNSTGLSAKNFYAAVVDDDNVKWFITDAGIVSFDRGKWKLHNGNRKVPTQNLRDFAYDFSSYGPELWIATPNGATVASLPIDGRTGATTYHSENTPILSKNVLRVAIGHKAMRWFGTDKGISAFRNKKWLIPSYDRVYPEDFFQEFPITSMAANRNGDSLYVGTDGAGVARVFRNNADAISGASVYAQWGPIIMPSDKIYSIYIATDGTQWFGTDQGIARHTGNNTLEKWTVFTTDDGLVHNYVQAIAADNKGNVWFGTQGGISVFNGITWSSYTIKDGLNSNNILCIAVDRNNIVWIGTDEGITCYNNGVFIRYK